MLVAWLGFQDKHQKPSQVCCEAARHQHPVTPFVGGGEKAQPSFPTNRVDKGLVMWTSSPSTPYH